MSALRAEMAQLAQMAARGLGPLRLGLVSSFDGRVGAYAVKVRIQPDDVETGWLPIATLLPGSAWGIYAAPSVGDQAIVLFQEGDGLAGICVGFLGSDEDPPPAIESGEIIIAAKDADASIKLDAEGNITSKGTWTHEGSFHATENVTSEADIIDHSDGTSGVTLEELRDSYNAHHHSGVQAGGSLTGATDDPAA